MYIAFAVGELEASRYVDVIGLSTSSAHEAVNNAAAAVAKKARGRMHMRVAETARFFWGRAAREFCRSFAARRARGVKVAQDAETPQCQRLAAEVLGGNCAGLKFKRKAGLLESRRKTRGLGNKKPACFSTGGRKSGDFIRIAFKSGSG